MYYVRIADRPELPIAEECDALELAADAVLAGQSVRVEYRATPRHSPLLVTEYSAAA